MLTLPWVTHSVQGPDMSHWGMTSLFELWRTLDNVLRGPGLLLTCKLGPVLHNRASLHLHGWNREADILLSQEMLSSECVTMRDRMEKSMNEWMDG